LKVRSARPFFGIGSDYLTLHPGGKKYVSKYERAFLRFVSSMFSDEMSVAGFGPDIVVVVGSQRKILP
jgi:hypothetical protein